MATSTQPRSRNRRSQPDERSQVAPPRPTNEKGKIEDFIEVLLSEPKNPADVELRLTTRAAWFYHDTVGQAIRDRKVPAPIGMHHYKLPALLAKLRGRIVGAMVCGVLPKTDFPKLRKALEAVAEINPMGIGASNPAFAELTHTIDGINECLYNLIRNSPAHEANYEAARQSRFAARNGMPHPEEGDEDQMEGDLPF